MVARLVVLGVVGACMAPSASLAQTASAAQYGGPAAETTPPVQSTSPSSNPPATPINSVAGEQVTVPRTPAVTPAPRRHHAAPAATPVVADPVVPQSTLPFTGLELALIAASALGLIGVGLALRRAAGRAPSGA
jgi:hypothetical protein